MYIPLYIHDEDKVLPVTDLLPAFNPDRLEIDIFRDVGDDRLLVGIVLVMVQYIYVDDRLSMANASAWHYYKYTR